MRGIDINEFYEHQHQSNDRILLCFSKYKRDRRMKSNPN